MVSMSENELEIYNRLVQKSKSINESATGSQTIRGVAYPETNEMNNILIYEFIERTEESCQSLEDVYKAVKIIEKLMQSELPKIVRAFYPRAGAMLVYMMLRKLNKNGNKKISKYLEVIHMDGVLLFLELEEYSQMIGLYEDIYLIAIQIKYGDLFKKLKRWRETIEKEYEKNRIMRVDAWYYKKMKFVIKRGYTDGEMEYLQDIKRSMEYKINALGEQNVQNKENKKIIYELLQKEIDARMYDYEGKKEESNRLWEKIKQISSGPASRSWMELKK